MDRALGAGRMADAGIGSAIVTMAIENTILFGQAVKYGTDKETQVKMWDGASANDIFAGVAAHSVTGDLDNDQYIKGQPGAICKKGEIWVKVSPDSAGVTPGKRVAIRPDGFFDAAPLPSSAVAALVTLEPAGDNNDVKVTAKVAGAAGNSIKVQLKDPAGNDQPLKVTMENDTIIVSLATGAAGAIESTAAQVIAAINSALYVKDIVTAANGAGSDGSGVVTAIAATPLAAGAAANGSYGVEIDGSEFLTAAAAGQLAKISINLPCKNINVQI